MSINHVTLMGRIANDLEIRATQSGISVLTFVLAVDRYFVKQGEERQADFITCVAWRQNAEFINKHFAKGRMIAVEGVLQTRTYDDKNGNRRKATEVIVEKASFTGERTQQDSGDQPDSDPISISDLDDFEEILSDDGVLFEN